MLICLFYVVCIIRYPHKLPYLIIYIVPLLHSEMVINNMPPGHLLYPPKTEIIVIPLFKREYHIDKFFTPLRNISYPLMRIGYTDHCFVRINANRPGLLQFGYKMTKQR